MNTVVEFPDRRVVAEEAAAWLIRLDADTPPTDAELRALGAWLHRSPVHHEELERLAALWARLNVLTELAVPLDHASRRSHLAWGRGALAAATLAAVIAIGIVLLAPPSALGPRPPTNGLYATAVGQQKTTVLADGSQVVLNTNSQIKVDYHDGYRNVQLLQGEALFKVAKDTARPFRVYAGRGRIEALGTAFSVYLNGAAISVAVTEGRVSLAALDPSRASAAQLQGASAPRTQAAEGEPDLDRGLVESLGTLGAGHVATISTSPQGAAGAGSTLEAVEAIAPEELAQRLAWREGLLMFSGERLEQVIKEFGRYTTVTIDIPDARVRDMRIGGRFPAGETEAMFAALEANFNLRVTRVGPDHVEISASQE